MVFFSTGAGFKFSFDVYSLGRYQLRSLVGTYLSDLLLRTLVVGRRQQSESIEAALDME